MSSVRSLILSISTILLFLIPAANAVAAANLTPSHNQIGARFAMGSLSNQGTVGGSSTFNSPDAYAIRFVVPNIAVGFGTDLVLSAKLDRVHLWGLRGLARYYFAGQAVPSINASEFASYSSRSRLPVYVGLDLRRYTYYFTNPGVEDFEPEGTFFNTNAQVGFDWFIGRTTAVNFELSMTLLTFSTAQEIFRFSTTTGLVGLTYDF